MFSRHVGDLGNIVENEDGTIQFQIIDDYISLQSNSTYNIVGRAIVVS